MSREEVLTRIRGALGPQAHRHHETKGPAAYARSLELEPAKVIDLFENRLKDYGARVFHGQPSTLRNTIASILQDCGRQNIVVPHGIDRAWLDLHVHWVRDEDLSYAELDAADGALTAATCAVAESGTIVLQHDAREGRRAMTLLPDYHLCVVRADQIVGTLPECMAVLQRTAQRPTTFISGPSATADIEMTRIQGVHGPRSLDVCILLEN